MDRALRRPRIRTVLIWLFLFAYVPFLIAHGIAAWRQPAVDFPPLYFATKVVFDEHRSPYGDDAFSRQATALGRWVPEFIYPPPSLLLLYPFHWFSYDTAKALMLLVNHLCLVGAAGFMLGKLFREYFGHAHMALTAAVVIVYILLFDPAVVTLHLGQVNLILLAFLCLTWHALKRNAGDLAVAVPLSLAIVIKTYPILLLPLLAFRKRYRAAILTVVLFALCCVASYFLLPREVWHEWIAKVLPRNSETHAGPWNQNIRAFVARAFLPNPFSDPLLALPQVVYPLIAVASLAVIGATLFAVFRASRAGANPAALDLEMSLFLFMIFLVAPVSWEHHFVYLLPSLVLVLILALEGKLTGHWRWIVPTCLCIIGWHIAIASPDLTKGAKTLLISAKFYPAVALWLFFLFQTRSLAAQPLSVGR